VLLKAEGGPAHEQHDLTTFEGLAVNPLDEDWETERVSVEGETAIKIGDRDRDVCETF
jgi:hypothetical protein